MQRIVPVTSTYREIPRMTSEAARAGHGPRRDVMAAIPRVDWRLILGANHCTARTGHLPTRGHFGRLLYKQLAPREGIAEVT